MDNASAVGGTEGVVGSPSRLRLSSLLVALTLVLGSFVLVQHRAEAVPRASVAVAGTSSGVSAQISAASIACPILVALRNTFAGTFIGPFVTPILNALIAAFGCAPSPG